MSTTSPQDPSLQTAISLPPSTAIKVRPDLAKEIDKALSGKIKLFINFGIKHIDIKPSSH